MHLKELKYMLIIGLFSYLELSHTITVFGHGTGA